MKTIVVINQKGGVGKSTTVQALGAALRARKKRVLFVDMDAQGNLSDTLGFAPGDAGASPTLLSLLEKRLPEEERAELVAPAIVRTPGGDLIPYSPSLAAADLKVDGVGKEKRLAEVLECVAERYDYALVDTPPALGVLTVNALSAADGAIIPAQADTYSLHGIGQLYDTIDAVREYTNPKLEVLGIVLTRYNGRSVLSRDVAESMEAAARKLGTKLCKTRIRECVALREAQASRQDIFSYAPRSNAAQDYAALAKELQKAL